MPGSENAHDREWFPLDEEFAAEIRGKLFLTRKVFAKKRANRTDLLDPEDFPADLRLTLREPRLGLA